MHRTWTDCAIVCTIGPRCRRKSCGPPALIGGEARARVRLPYPHKVALPRHQNPGHSETGVIQVRPRLALVYDRIYPLLNGGGERRFYEIGRRLAHEFEVGF